LYVVALKVPLTSILSPIGGEGRVTGCIATDFHSHGCDRGIGQRRFAVAPDCFASLAITKPISAAASEIETDGDHIAVGHEVVSPFQA